MAPTSETQQEEQLRKRWNAQKQEEQEQPTKSTQPSYTSEQADAVRRIKKCKDYYEILMVSKDATDSEIKKQYKKLALQLHPDKNHYPGAGEAFKAIGNYFVILVAEIFLQSILIVGNAVAVLTDVEKRKQYDLYGADEGRQRTSTHTYSRGFESDATAEELFNMFFGGGFANSNVYVRRNGRWHRQNGGGTTEGHTHREVIILCCAKRVFLFRFLLTAAAKQLHSSYTVTTNSFSHFVVNGFKSFYIRSSVQFATKQVSLIS